MFDIYEIRQLSLLVIFLLIGFVVGSIIELQGGKENE